MTNVIYIFALEYQFQYTAAAAAAPFEAAATTINQLIEAPKGTTGLSGITLIQYY